MHIPKAFDCWEIILSSNKTMPNRILTTHRYSGVRRILLILFPFKDGHQIVPDLNALDYHVWNAIATNMDWIQVKDYSSLITEIERGIRHVPIDALSRSIESWSKRILSILRNKGAYVR